MAKSVGSGGVKVQFTPPHRKTSIGNSVNSRPVNKHKRRMSKPYKEQGR